MRVQLIRRLLICGPFKKNQNNSQKLSWENLKKYWIAKKHNVSN